MRAGHGGHSGDVADVDDDVALSLVEFDGFLCVVDLGSTEVLRALGMFRVERGCCRRWGGG